jgi:hypothetical protein
MAARWSRFSSAILSRDELGGLTAKSVSVPLQAIANLTVSLATRGIGVVTSDGVPLHIDHFNVTETEDLVGAAAKSYVDWYMLTQVHTQPSRA